MAKKVDLSKVVGTEKVVIDKAVLESFASDNSSVLGNAPQCVAKPRSMTDVQEIVKLANNSGLALVPCSSGNPHYRGDTVPSVPDAVIVDLSEMDSIVRLDKRNKVALIEPGVTFGRLIEAAEKEGLRVVMPLLPRKTKSVIGSFLEKEPTTIPKYHWDMSDPLCCIEVIFGTGDLFRTGSAAGPGTLEQQWASGQAQKSPMGPSQTDLMKIVQGSQGTMGIVTWASVKLELLPKIQKAFFVGTQKLDDLIDFTYSILKPRLSDICLIVNNVNFAAMCGLSNKEITDLRKNLPSWILIYSISGYEHFPEDRVAYIEKDIADSASEKKLSPVTSLAGISAQKVLGIISKPSDEPYWKNRLGGDCRDIFFLTTLDKTPGFTKTMEAEAEKHGLEKNNLGVYIQPIQQGRGCHIEFTLMHDPKNADQVKKVKELFDSASKTLCDMGGFFSRPYGSWANLAYGKCPDTVNALRKVKGIFDPKGVMNPGKLCFGKGE